MAESHVIFDIQVPQAGEETTPSLPVFLVSAALDATCRLADGMKGNKADIIIGMVKKRIAGEIKSQSNIHFAC